MTYSIAQKSKIKREILNKVSLKLNFADDEMLDELMEQFGVHLDEDCVIVDTRHMKILVLGSLAGNVDNYKTAAKRMNVTNNNIVFENDYEKLHGYNVEKLRNSDIYSDIIYGPTPHKMTGIDGFNSALAMMKADPSNYPRVIEATANGVLKISVNSFKSALLRTRYIEALNA